MTIVFNRTGTGRVSTAPPGRVNHASSDRVAPPYLPRIRRARLLRSLVRAMRVGPIGRVP